MINTTEDDIALPTSRELYDLAQTIITEATAVHATLATAESCTGGLVAGALTAVPGSSEAVLGGIVSYAIAVKQRVLGVSQDIFARPEVGAVSAECAAGMCEGARRVLHASLAVSITGIAGPGGAEPHKPVGTVWFGLASPSSTMTVHHLFTGSRDEVRTKAVYVALSLLLRGIRSI